MFVLMREISPYSASDLLLGVFSTRAMAKAAKAYYARVREANPTADPWKNQAMKQDVGVSRDLAIKWLFGGFGGFEIGTLVFVVSDYKEGFGQIVRKLISIHSTPEAAEARVRKLDGTKPRGFPFPHYAEIDPVFVGRLHSDLPEDQPQLNRAWDPNRPPLIQGARRAFRAG